MRRIPKYDWRHGYHRMVMACTALSLLLAILAFRFWPDPSEAPSDNITYHVRGQELIEVEEILPTEQRRQKPPPPAPLIPVVVPNDVILEETDIDVGDNFLTVEDTSIDVEDVEGEETAPQAVLASAQVGPKPVRFVEPEYTREARRKKIRAEVVVEVLVDARGRVQDAKIVERYLLGKEDDREAVNALGFGLEESALSAAERWMFRPARQGGKPVQSFYQLTISFGV